MSQDQAGQHDASEAARRLAQALDPVAIDALLADASTAGTPIDGVDGLLNQMTKAVLERSLATEMTHRGLFTRHVEVQSDDGRDRVSERVERSAVVGKHSGARHAEDLVLRGARARL